eukprot:1149492-Pleurochrysis_carterae.AAC.1
MRLAYKGLHPLACPTRLAGHARYVPVTAFGCSSNPSQPKLTCQRGQGSWLRSPSFSCEMFSASKLRASFTEFEALQT